MPHLTLEYSDNLAAPVDWPQVLQALHSALDELGLFRLTEIKSRVVGYSGFLIGGGMIEGSFVHLTVAIWQGRSAGERRQISQACLATLQKHLASPGQQRNLDVTVEIREIDRESYGKWVSTPGH